MLISVVSVGGVRPLLFTLNPGLGQALHGRRQAHDRASRGTGGAQRFGDSLLRVARGCFPRPSASSGQRRFSEETLTRLGVIDVAKRAGFSLGDIRVLLSATDAGEPAQRSRCRNWRSAKLPEVRGTHPSGRRSVRRWLETASSCGCESLDVCGLFSERDSAAARGAPPRRHRRRQTTDRVSRPCEAEVRRASSGNR